jgi:hypothetical protein
MRDLHDSLEEQRPVWPVSSLRGEGFDPLCAWIEKRIKS